MEKPPDRSTEAGKSGLGLASPRSNTAFMSTYHHGNLREELITRAIETIGEKGVEGLSLRQLAKDLGVSHAAPTRHFKNKAELLSAIVAMAYERLTEAVAAGAGAASADEPIRRLNYMARATIQWALDNPAKYAVMTNPDVSRFAGDDTKQALAGFAAMIANALVEAQARGFQKNLSVQALLIYGVGAALGAATSMTDALILSALGPIEEDDIVSVIADAIVPVA